MPIFTGALGSTEIARKNWEHFAIGTAISGITLVCGEILRDAQLQGAGDERAELQGDQHVRSANNRALFLKNSTDHTTVVCCGLIQTAWLRTLMKPLAVNFILAPSDSDHRFTTGGSVAIGRSEQQSRTGSRLALPRRNKFDGAAICRKAAQFVAIPAVRAL